MIKQFLLNYEQELMENKIDLMKSFQNNEVSIKENEEYIRFVEASEDNNYESFLPQSYNTKNNLIKLKELKEKQKQLKEISARKKEEIEHIDQKLDELSVIIEEVKNDEDNRIQLDTTEKADRDKTRNSLIRKMKFCINLMDVDPKRCKLELQEIIKSL